MLFAFIILIVIANSGLIYADNNENSTENLFTLSADDLPEDSVNTTDNSSDNIINTNNENINNINQTENQNNIESSTSNSNDSNSEIETTSNNSNYTDSNNTDSQNNNSTKNISEEANEVNTTLPVSLATESNTNSTQSSSNSSSNSSSSENIITTFSAGLSSVTKFSTKDIANAATELKKYVEKYGKLPDYLTLCGEKLSMSDFLYLLAKSIVNTNSGNSADITAKDVKDPTSPSGSVTSGQLSKTNYMDLAKRVVSFIESNNRAPNYGSSSLGNIKFQTMIYGFAKIVDFFGTNNRLPNYVTFEKATSTSLNKIIPNYSGSNGLTVSGSSSGNNSGGSSGNNNNNSTGNNTGSNSSSNSGTISLANIKDAGARIEAFVNTNGVLPNYVEIAGKQYSMTEFLYLAASAIVNINKGLTSDITAKTFKNASSPTGSSISGNIYKSDFVDLASRVASYMLKNGQAPNYGSSSLGKMQFQTMVLAFSKILEFAQSEGRLPNYLTLNIKSTDKLNGGSGSSSGSIGGSDSIPTGPLNEKNTLSASELLKYLQATTNCQVNNAAIQSLAASLTKNCKTELEKATAIFNYVRDNIVYSSYSNTKRGAVQTLNDKKGNCVDQAHLLIALYRASGLEARYVHADCYFTSKKWIGHVFVQVLVGDTWVVADPVSSSNSLGVIKNWNTNTYKLKGQKKSVSISF